MTQDIHPPLTLHTPGGRAHITPPKRSLYIDGVAAKTHTSARRPSSVATPVQTPSSSAASIAALPAVAVLPVERPFAKPAKVPKAKRSIPDWLQFPIIMLLGTAGGFLAQSAAFGQLAVILYGLIAVIWRLPSRVTFILALMSMSTTVIMTTIMPNDLLSQNFATYTFLLLVVGVISLSRELKQEGGRPYPKRER
ncbi:MAG TPA: hypothetical protein VJ836_04855 [Candidatus Saccharimonadales bacterium]|nr:hypothetical protein [Candidatus Saccharimonadales bacterium]